MTVTKKGAISLVLAVGFEKVFHGQMQNYLDKLKVIGWNSLGITLKMNELFSSAGLALQVFYYSANYYCYANFSTVSGQNFRGQKSLRGDGQTA